MANKNGINILLLIFLVLLIHNGYSLNTVKRKWVKMKSFTMQITITYDKKREDIAAYYLNRAALYLPALEKYLDFEFPYKKITIYCHEEKGHAHQFKNEIHLIDRQVRYKLPSVLYHELGHIYFTGWTQHWFFEGVNSFLPIALMDYRFLNKRTAEYDNVISTWGLKNTNTEKDKPCLPDFRKQNFHYFYIKTFKIQYLVYKELGKENYRNFLKDLAGHTFKYSFTSDLIVHYLKKYKDINWKHFLSGWVFKGRYTKFTIHSFMDKNVNNSLDIDDYYKKYKQGLPLYYGYKKPLKKNGKKDLSLTNKRNKTLFLAGLWNMNIKPGRYSYTFHENGQYTYSSDFTGNMEKGRWFVQEMNTDTEFILELYPKWNNYGGRLDYYTLSVEIINDDSIYINQFQNIKETLYRQSIEIPR